LEKVSERKDLGIVISNNLKVSKQSTEAYAKANKMPGVINRTIVYKYTHNLLQFYKSLVRPHPDYCILAWSQHNNKNKQLLERIQRQFTRMLPSICKSSAFGQLKQGDIVSTLSKFIRCYMQNLQLIWTVF